MENILEKKYTEPLRPYSKLELNFLRNNLYKLLNISSKGIKHDRCEHFYYCKKYGKKFNEISNNNNDIGNCSVCWSIFNTDKPYKNIAKDLSKEYADIFDTDRKIFTHYEIELENLFYNWLYQKNN